MWIGNWKWREWEETALEPGVGAPVKRFSSKAIFIYIYIKLYIQAIHYYVVFTRIPQRYIFLDIKSSLLRSHCCFLFFWNFSTSNKIELLIWTGCEMQNRTILLICISRSCCFGYCSRFFHCVAFFVGCFSFNVPNTELNSCEMSLKWIYVCSMYNKTNDYYEYWILLREKITKLAKW